VTQKNRLSHPILMLVSDRGLVINRPASEAILDAAAGNVTAVQLREKELPASELIQIASRLKAGLPEGVSLIINDRVDVALACRADGVQLGAGSISVSVARAIAPDLLIGASVHALDEAIQAERDGADYLIVGTMFISRSHPGKVPEGLTLMRNIREAVRLPLIGIGGITADNAPSVMTAGADGVAVISDILSASNPTQAARRLWLALQ
jgi:thiamine-phosphate pyrophosphorylase